MNKLKNWFQALSADQKKRLWVITAIVAVVIILVIVGIVFFVKKQDKPSTPPVPKTTINTQEQTEPETDPPTETETETKTEVSTEPQTEPATKKPASSSNKKSDSKHSNAQQKPQNNPAPPINNGANNMSQEEKMKLAMQEQGVSSETEYWKKVEGHKNYKCPYCGSASCPSIAHNYDVLGNPYSNYYDNNHPCPVYAAGKAKCPSCGKTLVDDNRWYTDPEHYCDGFCQNVFG